MRSLLFFVTGPVDKDYVGGVLYDWHLEVFNNSDNTINVELKVFDISGDSSVLIGDTSRQVNPNGNALPGAIFFNKQLIQLPNGLP